MTSDPTEKSPPEPGQPDTGKSNTGKSGSPEPATVPVDGEAQEEAGKVREKSGGYD